MFQVVSKLHRLKGVLSKLNKERFHEVEKQTEAAEEVLMKCQIKLQLDPKNTTLIAEEAAAALEYKK